jgi:Mrp family chromosome partitioning ATPase
VTDAVILAREADATLLVIAAGETKRGQVEEAAELLAQVVGTRVGVILNEVEVGGRYGYRDRYGNYGNYAPPASNAEINGNGGARARRRRGAGAPGRAES